jgi:hypothetical protein
MIPSGRKRQPAEKYLRKLGGGGGRVISGFIERCSCKQDNIGMLLRTIEVQLKL